MSFHLSKDAVIEGNCLCRQQAYSVLEQSYRKRYLALPPTVYPVESVQSMTLKQTSRLELNVCASCVSSSFLYSLFHVIMADFSPTLEIKRLCANKNVQMQPNTQK